VPGLRNNRSQAAAEIHPVTAASFSIVDGEEVLSENKVDQMTIKTSN
jgi:hypothetical protein